jgi:hypothetical protein
VVEEEYVIKYLFCSGGSSISENPQFWGKCYFKANSRETDVKFQNIFLQSFKFQSYRPHMTCQAQQRVRNHVKCVYGAWRVGGDDILWKDDSIFRQVRKIKRQTKEKHRSAASPSSYDGAWSWSSRVSNVTGYGKKRWVRFPTGFKIFLSLASSDQFPGPPGLILYSYLPPSNAKVRSEWIYTSTPLYFCMEWR